MSQRADICGLSLVACCLTLLTGCVRRSLTIKSDPPGALVYVNDRLLGESPVTYDFTWYGWHRVMLRKDGFQRVEDRRQLRAPAYLWIPLDFVMELLPVPVRDRRTWTYTLAPSLALPEPAPPRLETPGAPAEPAPDAAPTTPEPADGPAG